MKQIAIKSKLLAYALGARNNKIKLAELKNTRVLDFNLIEYLSGHNDIISTNCSIKDNNVRQTNLFMFELAKLLKYENVDIEHIKLSGLDFEQCNLNGIYKIKKLKSLTLENNANCFLDLYKFANLKNLKLDIDNAETKVVKLEEYTKKCMNLSSNPTQYDIYLATKRNNFSNVTIDIKDMDIIHKYTDNLPTIAIKNTNDIKEIKKRKLSNINIGLKLAEIIDLVELSQLVDYVNELVQKKDKGIRFNQVIDNVSELSIDKLRVITDKILPAAHFNSIKVFKYIDCYEEYDIDTYIKIRKRIDSLIKNIPSNLPDIDKFIAVQNAILYNVSIEQATQNTNDRLENLIGALLYKKTTNIGYADIFRNMLHCVNLDAKFVQSDAKQSRYAWNQVKFGYKWYNTDLIADRYNIIQGLPPRFCLKSDYEFYKNNIHYINHRDVKYMNLKQCDISYNMGIVNNILDKQLYKCEPELIIDTVNGMRNADKKEYNIFFVPTQDVELQIGTVYEEKGKRVTQYTSMYIEKENIAQFMRVYLEQYAPQYSVNNDIENNLTTIYTQQHTGIILGPNIRKRLYEEGVLDVRNEIEIQHDIALKDCPIDIMPNE